MTTLRQTQGEDKKSSRRKKKNDETIEEISSRLMQLSDATLLD